MPPIERTRAWVTFFKALADENRLKIVGLLAHKPHSVEEIAALLHISPATASHHLQRLLAADLVEARALQYYNVYALRPDALRQMAEQLLTVESIKETVQTLDLDGYDCVIDAILGTGSSGAVRGIAADVIRAINDSDALVLSVDIPSGLGSDGDDALFQFGQYAHVTLPCANSRTEFSQIAAQQRPQLSIPRKTLVVLFPLHFSRLKCAIQLHHRCDAVCQR